MKSDLFSELEAKWPSAIVSRNQVGQFSGGLVSAGTMANMDSRGQGPAQRILMGQRRVAYPVRELTDWLRKRCNVINKEGEK